MSISSIATELYNIQSKKKVPLKTAAAMMLREELSARFSVYNLVRIVTKSEFLATVARIKYGERTPMQKQQDKEDQEKEQTELKFKKFTLSSFSSINRKIALLSNITQRNTELINGLYNELGAFRGQRRIGANNFNPRAARVPVLSKTIKGRLDLINDEIEKLKKIRTPKVKKTPAAQKVKTKKEDDDFLTSFLPFLISNPRLLGILAGGTTAAVSLGSYMAQAYSLYNAPGAVGRIGERLGGKPSYADPMTEQISQGVDTAIATTGAFTAGGLITAGALKYRKMKMGDKATQQMAESAARMKAMNKYYATYKQKGMSTAEARKKAGARVKQFYQLKKWNVIAPLFKGVAKTLPALAAADVALQISSMSGYIADHSQGKMNDNEFEQKMSEGYGQLFTTIGVGGMSTIAGAAIGTAMFPGLGTFAGALGGGVLGAIASIIIEEDRESPEGFGYSVGNKLFNVFHKDKGLYAGEKEIRASTEFKKEKSAKPAREKTFTEKVSDMLNPFGNTPAAGESVDAKYAMEFFIQKGWTPAQAAGIVGNLQQESGATLNTAAYNESENAYGIAQWRNERISKFEEVYGKSLYTAGRDEQLEYVHWELLNSEKLAGQLLRGAGDFAAAAQIVDEHYERSAGTERVQRINNAKELLKQYELRSGNGRQLSAQEFNDMTKPNQTVSLPPVAETEVKKQDKAQVDMMAESKANMIATNRLSNATIAMGQKVDQLQKQQSSGQRSFFVQNQDPTFSSFRG